MHKNTAFKRLNFSFGLIDGFFEKCYNYALIRICFLQKGGNKMILPVKAGQTNYDIVIESGCLKRAGELLSLNRKVLVVTDDGVPPQYAETVASFCDKAIIKTVPQGECSKSFKVLEELEFILGKLTNQPLKAQLDIDLTLARGLNYYTGAILEVKALDVQIGSITGGGRYDNLTGVFGMPNVSGVGMSFGADRIYDVLSQLDLFPTDSLQATQVLFVNFGDKECDVCMQHATLFRAQGIRTEVFPESAKMKKQMGYADTHHIPYVALVGESEIEAGKIALKNMITGEQQLVTPQEAIDIITR